jgi:hypothetical protein|nr:MAG TPA: hypothetical protein [Caudoviricetes sp.]DAT24754.1 MAG TPA: hypothetical protein [Caudoviricetes sp.]
MKTKNYSREELTGMEFKELQRALEENLNEYGEELKKLKKKDLEKEEENLIKIQEDFDIVIGETEYELPDTSEYRGYTTSRKDLAAKIIYFLNKLECNWQTSLGVYEAIALWKNIGKTISYATYDSTIRILGSMRFKGETELRDILIINHFLTSAEQAYLRDTIYIQYLAGKHNAVMQALNPQPEEVETINE